MRLLGQFQASLFFFFLQKDFEQTKSTKTQTSDLFPLDVFHAHKIAAFLVFVRFFAICAFCAFMLLCFYDLVLFVRSKSFRKKTMKKFQIALIASFTLLLKSSYH